MEIVSDGVGTLRAEFAKSPSVWFFVDVKYRILYFNEKAASNSLLFHNKKLKSGDSILDYARDTANRVDKEFITCLGKAASGQLISREQQIVYKEKSVWTSSTYKPVYTHETLLGISIEVEDITGLKQR